MCWNIGLHYWHVTSFKLNICRNLLLEKEKSNFTADDETDGTGRTSLQRIEQGHTQWTFV